MTFSRFNGLRLDEQAAFLAYFNDKEQEALSESSRDAEMHELDSGGLMMDAGGLAFAISDTTGADVLGGDSPDGL